VSTPLPRSEFAVTERYAYLNHASAGVLPRSSVSEIEAFVRTHAAQGVLGTFPYDLKMPEYREKIGRFVGASGAEIAMLSNTSTAANAIAAGLGWRAGDQILLCDNEFPANAIPWIALQRRGVEVRLLPTARERLTPDVLRRELSSRTRLVAVSWVSYGDGYRHDLAGLGEAAHAAGAFFCVDAMQGLGAFPLDVKRLDIDALYAGGAKWMLGLHGTAMLYVGSRLRERLELAMPGWRSMRDMWDFHNYDQPFSAEAMRLEGGTPNLIGTLSLACAIDLIERSGREAIARHILSLTDRLCEGLQRAGAKLSTHRGKTISSGIVTFSIPGCDSVALGEALAREGIVATHRPTGVRVSPHGYNSTAEIDAVVETLEQLTRSKVLVT
jgi:cysteine desulfurase / selenocysteine lyase